MDELDQIKMKNMNFKERMFYMSHKEKILALLGYLIFSLFFVVNGILMISDKEDSSVPFWGLLCIIIFFGLSAVVFISHLVIRSFTKDKFGNLTESSFKKEIL